MTDRRPLSETVKGLSLEALDAFLFGAELEVARAERELEAAVKYAALYQSEKRRREE